MADQNASVLGQILRGVEKIPGNILGGGVDLSNSVLNLLRAGYGYAGHKAGLLSAEDLPNLEENPIGGSKWFNRPFGLDKSTGPIDETTQFIGGLVNPARSIGTALKAGALMKGVGAVVLPAALIKEPATVEAASRFLAQGAKPESVFKASGIFPGLEESAPLKAVLPDTNARLESVGGVIRSQATSGSGWSTTGAQASVRIPSSFEGYLPDVLSHPELYSVLPELRNIRIRAGDQPGAGSYSRDTKTITAGTTSSEEGMTSLLLHETQHAIQDLSGFMGGGNSGMFMKNPVAIQSALQEAKKSGDTSTANAFQDVLTQARSRYLNIGGELEAGIVQYQRAKNDYSSNPAELAKKLAGGRENIIDPKKLPPALDEDSTVQSILQSYQ